jgi:hypothetical protein
MEYLIFALAVLLVACCLRFFEPYRKGSRPRENQLLPLVGPVAHVGGSLLIGWFGGLALAALAFVTIPVLAYVIHSLAILPALRARSLRRGKVTRQKARKPASPTA